MNLPAIINLLFPMTQSVNLSDGRRYLEDKRAAILCNIRPMPDMLRAYADSQRCPTRSQDGRYEVFIAGQWVDMPEDYAGLRAILNRQQL